MRPTAFGWIDYDTSTSPAQDQAQVRRLARSLGYRIVWADIRSLLPVAEQVRNARTNTVIVPAPDHLTPPELHQVLDIADVETVHPRLSYFRAHTAGIPL